MEREANAIIVNLELTGIFVSRRTSNTVDLGGEDHDIRDNRADTASG